MEKAIAALREKIEASKKWASDGFPGSIDGLKLRTYDCIVTPFEFINEADRAGRY